MEQKENLRRSIDKYETKIIELRGTIKKVTSKPTGTFSNQTITLKRRINKTTQTNDNAKEILTTQTTNYFSNGEKADYACLHSNTNRGK